MNCFSQTPRLLMQMSRAVVAGGFHPGFEAAAKMRLSLIRTRGVKEILRCGSLHHFRDFSKEES